MKRPLRILCALVVIGALQLSATKIPVSNGSFGCSFSNSNSTAPIASANCVE